MGFFVGMGMGCSSWICRVLIHLIYSSMTEMAKRVSMLVITDGLCWVPICIIFLISHRQVLPDTVYFVTACILLPINSAINPIIYSQYFYKLLITLGDKFKRMPERNEEIGCPDTWNQRIFLQTDDDDIYWPPFRHPWINLLYRRAKKINQILWNS